MILGLTRDADKMVCVIYKAFLQERKDGRSKAEARRFEESSLNKFPAFNSWQMQDISDTIHELHSKGLVKKFITGDFELSDSGIVYMENRFKNGLLEVTDFISKFMP